jgi:hypothetical protein
LKQLKPYHLLLQFIVLPLILVLALYFKPKIDLKNIPTSFTIAFWIGISLMPINWLLEFLKWKLILRNLNLSERQEKISFASGIISEFLIPGIPSNFIGRIFFFEKKDRIKLSAWIQVGNLGQFGITLFFGIFSMVYLNFTISSNSIYFTAVLALAVALFSLLRKFNIINLPAEIQKLAIKKHDFKPISLLLLLSLIRFLVFSLQFGLILHSFSMVFDFQLFTYIWISYLFVSFSPSLFLGNLVVRESITVSIFQLGNYPIFPVLYGAFIIWLVNNFIPVCLAWCYITFFKKSE